MNCKRILITLAILLTATAILFSGCFFNDDEPSDNGDQGQDVYPGYFSFPDIAYDRIPGIDPNLTSLDIYIPQKGNNFPICIYIHGGAWILGDKDNVDYKPEAFTRQGYMLVSINYRLSPAAKHPVHAQDVANAISWVYENASIYKGDNSRISIMGHSAGAHLAALVATDERYLESKGLDLDAIKAVVLLDGAGYDIPRLIELYRLAYFPIYSIPFGDDPAGWVDASPVYHITSGKGIGPFILFHVGNREASRLEAEWLSQKLLEAGVTAEVIHAPDKDHSSINKELGMPDDWVTEEVFSFLSRYL